MVSAFHHANYFIQKNALISSVTSAVINGVIGWFMFRGKQTLALTVDTISATEKTVFSTGVMTAFMVSVILGTIAFFTFRKKAKTFQVAFPELLDRPFFFFGVRTILFYALFAFGTAALVALFLQKFLGTIQVTPIIGAIVLGMIAGVASLFINRAVMMVSFSGWFLGKWSNFTSLWWWQAGAPETRINLGRYVIYSASKCNVRLGIPPNFGEGFPIERVVTLGRTRNKIKCSDSNLRILLAFGRAETSPPCLLIRG